MSQATTGGTTGSPLTLIRSLSSIAVEQAAIDVAISAMELDASDARIAVLRADSIKEPADRHPPFWIFAAGGRRLVLSAHHLAHDTLPHYINAIERFAPDLLWVYPTALETLCMLLKKQGSSVVVPRVLSSSEILSSAVWRLAQGTLGCRLVDYYGQAERVAFSVAEAPDAHRFLSGYSHVELIPTGEEGANRYFDIVGTSLWNDAMPLVRYRTGDTICLPAEVSQRELSDIALGLTTFTGVLGRSNEYLIAPNGARIIGLNHFPRGTQHVVRLQVIQEATDQVNVLVLATSGYDQCEQDTLLKNIRQKVPESVKVSILKVDVLEKTNMGKTPYVIRRLTLRDRAD